MSLKTINEKCERALEELEAKAQEIPKGKELPPLTDESSERPARASRAVQDYHTAFEEICQEDDAIKAIEEKLEEAVRYIYSRQSADWQHGFNTGQKLTELRAVIEKARKGYEY